MYSEDSNSGVSVWEIDILSSVLTAVPNTHSINSLAFSKTAIDCFFGIFCMDEYLSINKHHFLSSFPTLTAFISSFLKFVF